MMKAWKKAMALGCLTAVLGSGRAFAYTAQDMISMNPEAYTAGTGSVYGPALSQEQLNQLAEVVAQFRTEYITDDMTEEEKVRAANDYIMDNCSYGGSWKYKFSNTAWAALVNHEALCSGYARGFKALCDSMGIGCCHVRTTDPESEHQWNMVKIDNMWYHIDTQTNDFAPDFADKFGISFDPPLAYDEAAYPKTGVAAEPTDDVVCGWVWEEEMWKWKKEDGSYARKEWIEDKGHTYYVDENGERYTGWATVDRQPFYFKENGVMATGWTEIDGKMYQFGPNGGLYLF